MSSSDLDHDDACRCFPCVELHKRVLLGLIDGEQAMRKRRYYRTKVTAAAAEPPYDIPRLLMELGSNKLALRELPKILLTLEKEYDLYPCARQIISGVFGVPISAHFPPYVLLEVYCDIYERFGEEMTEEELLKLLKHGEKLCRKGEDAVAFIERRIRRKIKIA